MARKQNLREGVYAMLRKRIMEGEIRYADRLVDHEIAEELGVSRMPVREALLQLKNEGYLEGTARGFRLQRFAPLDLAQVYEIRLLLEPRAAMEACRQVTMQGLGDMQVALHEARQAHRDDTAVGFMYAGWRFRKAWLDMGPNPHLAQTLGRLRDVADLARILALGNPEMRGGSLERTERIFEAFVARDPERAAACVEENLRLCGTAYYAEQVELLRREEV